MDVGCVSSWVTPCCAVCATGHPIHNDLVYGGQLFAENSHSCSQPGYKLHSVTGQADSSDAKKAGAINDWDRADCIDCRKSNTTRHCLLS